MKILRSTENLTMADLYNLTRNPETERMSDHVGEILNVDKFMIREEERADTGDVVTIVSIMDGNVVYATNSAVFVREFSGIVAMADEAHATIHKIRVANGESKKGRTFVTCVFVE